MFFFACFQHFESGASYFLPITKILPVLQSLQTLLTAPGIEGREFGLHDGLLFPGPESRRISVDGQPKKKTPHGVFNFIMQPGVPYSFLSDAPLSRAHRQKILQMIYLLILQKICVAEYAP